MYCVICLIFISKCDPFRNNSYQRETILKINRYSFTFSENVFRALLTGVGAWTMLAIFGFDWGKKKKKGKSRDSNPRQSSCSVFPRHTLSPVGHRGVLFQCEDETIWYQFAYFMWQNMTKRKHIIPVYGQNLMIFCTFSSFIINNSPRLCC